MRRVILILVAACRVSALGYAPQTPSEPSAAGQRLRRIILDSRHMGAHGLGYNEQSLKELSVKLRPGDIPHLLELAADRQLHVGAEFALASQCEASIVPVKEAAVEHTLSFLDAEDTLSLIEHSDVCTAEVRKRAAAAGSEIRTIEDAETIRAQQQAEADKVEDTRIQANGLKMLDPAQAKTLTRQEREEVFRRSLKAMGLSEDSPMTPGQKDLVQRMYRTMVLGESDGKRSPN